MTLAWDDTIAALASAPGPAPRGILRVSGPQLGACLRNCFPHLDPSICGRPHSSVVAAQLQLADDGRLVPCQLYLWPTRQSYTREPCAELHLPGSPPLLDAALATLCARGARLARPGEFTLRAFLAGRIDLTQAEAVLGVIDAHSEHEMQVALRQLAGGLGHPLHQLQDRLLDLLAHLEAGLDFVEEDIEFISSGELDATLAWAADELNTLITDLQRRSTVAEGYRVVLAGWPNTGKSSLLNALAESPLALVSPQAGTTRDYVTAQLRLGDLQLMLVDTAGWDAQADDDSIAAAAQQATVQQTADAHVTLFCVDGTRPLNLWEQQRLHALQAQPHLLVRTKADLADFCADPAAISVSSLSGQGLDQLRAALRVKLLDCTAVMGEALASTAVRCQDALRQAAEGIAQAQQIRAEHGGEELLAAELRLALDHLGRTVGAIVTDDILDRIFSRFCIGK